MGVREGQWLRGAQAQGVLVITAHTACARSDTRVQPAPHITALHPDHQPTITFQNKGASHIIIIKLKPEQISEKKE